MLRSEKPSAQKVWLLGTTFDSFIYFHIHIVLVVGNLKKKLDESAAWKQINDDICFLTRGYRRKKANCSISGWSFIKLYRCSVSGGGGRRTRCLLAAVGWLVDRRKFSFYGYFRELLASRWNIPRNLPSRECNCTNIGSQKRI